MRTEIIKCKKCGKNYNLGYVKYPCNMENSKRWDTFYTCPYCNNITEITLFSDEDVVTSKLE